MVLQWTPSLPWLPLSKLVDRELAASPDPSVCYLAPPSCCYCPLTWQCHSVIALPSNSPYFPWWPRLSPSFLCDCWSLSTIHVVYLLCTLVPRKFFQGTCHELHVHVWYTCACMMHGMYMYMYVACHEHAWHVHVHVCCMP